MRKLLIILVVLIVAPGCKYVPKGHVRVDFENKSSENIKSIVLPLLDKQISNLKVGEEETITFPNRGEGTYQFIVTFESGKQLKEGERYVEGGYAVTEYIFDTCVETEY